jgi:hypothetical protein
VSCVKTTNLVSLVVSIQFTLFVPLTIIQKFPFMAKKKNTPPVDAPNSEDVSTEVKEPKAKGKKGVTATSKADKNKEKEETAIPEEPTGNVEQDEDEDTGKQIALDEDTIFNMANGLLKAIKNESAADKAAFYHQTLDKGGVMSRLRGLRKNPGMSRGKLGEFDKLIEEIKALIESKLDGYKPGSGKVVKPTQEASKPAPAKPAAVTVPQHVAVDEGQKLKDFVQEAERILIQHTTSLPMTKQGCIDYIKKSARQYTVTINPSAQEPHMSIVTVSIGQYSEDLQPLKLH